MTRGCAKCQFLSQHRTNEKQCVNYNVIMNCEVLPQLMTTSKYTTRKKTRDGIIVCLLVANVLVLRHRPHAKTGHWNNNKLIITQLTNIFSNLKPTTWIPSTLKFSDILSKHRHVVLCNLWCTKMTHSECLWSRCTSIWHFTLRVTILHYLFKPDKDDKRRIYLPAICYFTVYRKSNKTASSSSTMFYFC